MLPFDLLLQLKQTLPEPTCQTVTAALRQDDLCWPAVCQSDRLPGDSTQDYSPAALGLAALAAAHTVAELRQVPLLPLDPDLRKRAVEAFQAVSACPQPPAGLADACLLALAIRERRRNKNTWQGLGVELESVLAGSELSLYSVWKTPLACLLGMSADGLDLARALLPANLGQASPAQRDTVLHMLLANPISPAEAADFLLALLAGVAPGGQVAWLRSLEATGRADVTASLARLLIDLDRGLPAAHSACQPADALSTDEPLDAVEALRSRGLLHAYAGDPAGAIGYQRQAGAAAARAQARISAELARSAAAFGDDHAALIAWQQAASFAPYSPAAQAGLAHALIAAGQLDEAAALLGEVEPHALTLLAGAELAARREDPAQARALVSRALESLADCDLSPEVIGQVAATGCYSAAAGLAARLLPARPADAGLLMLAAEANQRCGCAGEALRLAALATALAPGDIRARRQLAALLEAGEQWPAAFVERTRIIELDPQPETGDLLARAAAALKVGQPELAAGICQGVLTADDDDSHAHILLGEALAASGHFNEAIDHLIQATVLDPAGAAPWLALSRAHLGQGDRAKAYEALRAGTQAASQAPDVFLALGQFALDDGSPSEALPWLRKADELSGHDPAVSLRLGETLFSLNHFEEARRVLETARQTWTAHPGLALVLGRALLALSETEAALPVLQVSAQQVADDPEPHQLVAETILALNAAHPDDYPLALAAAALERALQINPSGFTVRLMLGETLLKLGDWTRAFDTFSGLTEREQTGDPQHYWRVHFGLGQAALALGKVEIALASLQEAASAQADNVAIQRALAEAYAQAKLTKEALHLAQLTLRMDPQDVDNLQWYARIMLALDLRADCVGAVRQALELAPERAGLRLWLASLLAEDGDRAAARALLADIPTLEGIQPAELLDAATWLERLDDFPAAITCLEKANAAGPSPEPGVLNRLIDAYRRQGNLIAALECVIQARGLNSNDLSLQMLEADLLAQLDRRGDALATLVNALQSCEAEPGAPGCPLETRAELHARIARLLRAAGDLPGAFNHAQEALQSAPLNLAHRHLTADLAFALIDDEVVEALCQPSAINPLLGEDDLTPANPAFASVMDMLCARIEIALARGDLDAARDTALPLGGLASASGRLLAAQARLALRQDDRAEALCLFASALAAEGIDPDAPALDPLAVQPGDPQTLWTWLALAEAALDLEEWKLANRLFRQAAALAPQEPRPQLRLARMLVLCAETQSTCAALKAITHAPGEESQRDGACRLFENAILVSSRLSPSVEIARWRNRGQAVFHPVQQTARSLAMQANDGEDAAALIAVLARLNNLADAQRVAAAYPDDPRVRFQLALALRDADPTAGLELTRQLSVELPGNPLIHALLAGLQLHQPEAARAAIERALQIWPDEPLWQKQAAELCDRLDDLPAAIEHWERVVALRPDDSWAALALGQAYFTTGQLTSAASALVNVTRLDPFMLDGWMLLAQAYAELGDAQPGLDAAERACELAPSQPEALVLSGELALRLGNFDRAIQKAQAVLELNQASTPAILLFARALDGMGHAGDALQAIETALSQADDPRPLQGERARLMLEVRGAAEALPLLRALNLDFPDQADLLAALALALAETGRADEAESTALSALRADPGRVEVHLLLGRIQRQKGQLDQAIHHLSEAIRSQPDQLEAYLELGRVYMERRDSLHAVKIFHQAIELNPDDARAYYFSGQALRESKDYINAEAMLRQAARLAPDDPNIRRQLGAIIALNLVHHPQETTPIL